jgi:hypothetical protein
MNQPNAAAVRGHHPGSGDNDSSSTEGIYMGTTIIVMGTTEMVKGTTLK